MKATFAASVALASLIAAPALAQDPSGDPDTGADLFERQCITCHVVVNDEGETLAGRNARTGPNLYGVAGSVAGTGALAGGRDFRYSNGLEALAEMGVEWTEENFVGYVQDPTPWIRETADNNRLRGSMTWKVRSEEEAHDLYAYLYSLAPPEGEGS
jgi:cytochrome c